MRHLNLIGPQVRRLRYKQGWSQNMLSVKLQLAGWDVTRGTVAKIESRLIWVGDFQLFYFTRVLKVELKDLFPPIDQQEPKMHETLTRLMNTRF
jgi:transcriptional regulator with XRE-family HTH domain